MTTEKKYPTKIYARHPYEEKIVDYIFIGIQKDFFNPRGEFPLYNTVPDEYTVALDTIVMCNPEIAQAVKDGEDDISLEKILRGMKDEK